MLSMVLLRASQVLFDEIDVDNNSVKVTVSMFGRENQVEF